MISEANARSRNGAGLNENKSGSVMSRSDTESGKYYEGRVGCLNTRTKDKAHREDAGKSQIVLLTASIIEGHKNDPHVT
jgi:hypothetical protein